MKQNLTLEALQKQLDSLRGQIEAMQDASEFRFARRDDAAERLHRRVTDLENDVRYAKDDLHRVQSERGAGRTKRRLSHTSVATDEAKRSKRGW